MAGQKYDYGIDFAAIDAIDIHAHVEADDHGHHAYDDELIAATKQYFKLNSEPTTVDAVAEYTGSATRPLSCSPSTRKPCPGIRPTPSRI